MDLDFPLILVGLTAVTGLVWLLDKLWLGKGRAEAVANYEAQQGPAGEEVREQLEKEPYLVELSKSVFPVFFVVLVLRSFVFEPFQIPSGSMIPTLKVGDFIVVNKFAYGLRLPVAGTKVLAIDDPQAGDVMVFKYPKDGKTNYIKRVIGVPGDKITYVNKQLVINGQPIAQDLQAQLPTGRPQIKIFHEALNGKTYSMQKTLMRQDRTGRWFTVPGKDGVWEVPEGHYFMVGDNRDNSNDSRFWGFVPDKLVVGKAVYVWMFWDQFFSIPSFAHTGPIN